MKNFRVAVLFAMLGTLISPSPSQAEYITKPEMGSITGAYLALLVEFGVLEKIRIAFPDLSPRIEAARDAFQAKFGTAVETIPATIADISPELGGSTAGIADKALQKSDEATNRAKAEAFLSTFEGYAKGDIDPASLKKTLLSWQYRQNPIQEMRDGFTDTLTVKEITQDRTLNVTITHPLSWEISADNPNLTDNPNPAVTIQSDAGDGIAGMIILRRPHVGDTGAVASDLEASIPGAKNVKTYDGRVGGYPAAIITMDRETNSDGLELTFREAIGAIPADPETLIEVLTFVFLPRTRAGEMDREWARFQPLFEAMLKTVEITPEPK